MQSANQVHVLKRTLLVFVTIMLLVTQFASPMTAQAQGIACTLNQRGTDANGNWYTCLLVNGVLTWVADTAVPIPHPDAPTASSTYDDEKFNADVTIPDGSQVTASQSFTKTWRLSNIGTTTWNGYTFCVTNAGGLTASSPCTTVPTTAPGATADVSIVFTAPSVNGPYTAYAQIKNASGTQFGKPVYVKVAVIGGTEPVGGTTYTQNNQQTYTGGSGTGCVTVVTSSSAHLCVNGVGYDMTPVAPGGTYKFNVGSQGTQQYVTKRVCAPGFDWWFFGWHHQDGACNDKTVPASPANWLPAAPTVDISADGTTTTYTYASSMVGTLTLQRIAVASLEKAVVEQSLQAAGVAVGSPVLVFSVAIGSVIYLQYALIPPAVYEGVPAVAAPLAPVFTATELSLATVAMTSTLALEAAEDHILEGQRAAMRLGLATYVWASTTQFNRCGHRPGSKDHDEAIVIEFPIPNKWGGSVQFLFNMTTKSRSTFLTGGSLPDGFSDIPCIDPLASQAYRAMKQLLDTLLNAGKLPLWPG